MGQSPTRHLTLAVLIVGAIAAAWMCAQAWSTPSPSCPQLLVNAPDRCVIDLLAPPKKIRSVEILTSREAPSGTTDRILRDTPRRYLIAELHDGIGTIGWGDRPDENLDGGIPFATSVARVVAVPAPNEIHRIIVEGWTGLDPSRGCIRIAISLD